MYNNIWIPQVSSTFNIRIFGTIKFITIIIIKKFARLYNKMTNMIQ